MSFNLLYFFDFFNFTIFIEINFFFQKLFAFLPNQFFFENPFYIGYILFLVGIYGLGFGKQNFLFFMVYAEVMLLGISCCFIFNSIFFFNLEGYIYAFLILNLAAAESALGLSLLITVYALQKNVSFKFLNSLKG